MAINSGNGLYYESGKIRNAVLSRNIGKYKGYKPSMYMDGGSAIGDPYAVIDEVTPESLDERMKHGQPKGLFLNEGGLFGYTHESVKLDDRWMNRGVNTAADSLTYFDYDSTAQLLFDLSLEPKGAAWWDVGNNHFDDYRGYIAGIFAGEGLSFFQDTDALTAKKVYLNDILNDYIPDGVGYFIDSFAGTIADDFIDRIFDTRLGKIGMAINQTNKQRQVNLSNMGKGKTITQDPHKFLGLGTGNENVYQRGYSIENVGYNTETSNDPERYIQDVSEIFEALDKRRINLQEEFLRRNLNKNTYVHLALRENGEGDSTYAKYYNISATSKRDKNTGEPIVEDWGGYSIEGAFRGVGVYDDGLQKNEHYDERDELNEETNRNTSSSKISYGAVTEDVEFNNFDVENLGIVNNLGFSSNEKSLLEKTKQLFKEHKIKTLIGRFHTSSDDMGAKDVSLTQSATNSKYGISHGRNLLKKDPEADADKNGYNNPYCRVWTYHHQYAKLTDMIRPFTENGKFMDVGALQREYPGRPIIHNQRENDWAGKTVLNRNGFVNIAPMKGTEGNKNVETKQCMFSIENLAWKSVLKNNSELDDCEIGPLGGRIMWFPPYNLQFNESVSANYGSNDFIGRGERIYSYTNTERSGTISFTILADHPSILDYWRKEKKKDADDQSVLRFFAGCDTLEAPGVVKEQQEGFKHNNVNVSAADILQAEENGQGGMNTPVDGQNDLTSSNEANVNEDKTPYMPNEFTKDNSIGFYMFFPNNLSGVDFKGNISMFLDYLMNGKNGFDYKSKTDIRPTMGGQGYEVAGGTGLTEETKQTEVKDYNTDAKNDKNRDYVWGYGVDYDKLQERLTGGTKTVYWQNYCDLANFNLNSTPLSADESCGYAFTDVVKSLYPSINVSDSDSKNVDKIKQILQIGETIAENKVRKFYFCVAGYASVQGVEDRNVGLSQRRRDFLKLMITSAFKNMNKDITFVESAIPVNTGIEGGENNNNVSSKSAKMGRYAKAVIYWKDEEVSDAVDSSESAIRVEANGEYSQTMYSTSGAYSDLNDISGFDKVDGVIDATWLENANNYGWYESAASPTYIATIKKEGDKWGRWDIVPVRDKQVYKENALPNKDNETDAVEEGEKNSNLEAELNTSNYASSRYGDEAEFFSLLTENDPVLYKKIVDKVKYFDPAFHAITPEGFNARLSFLHQCTRQGPTISSSDLSSNSMIDKAGYAGNLAFGRPPICVLRLGDFFNTRIVITSLQIQYEGSQWDLNPEGIGVQPMLANVTLGFTFQGGSSLGGPIQRLQNAISFNFYANQEVYDDRADSVVYKQDRSGRYIGEIDDEQSYIWVPGTGTTSIGDVKRFNENLAKIYQEADNKTKAETEAENTEDQTDAVHTEQEKEVKEAMEELSAVADAGTISPGAEQTYSKIVDGIKNNKPGEVMNALEKMTQDRSFEEVEAVYNSKSGKYFYNDIYEVIGNELTAYSDKVSDASVMNAIMGENGEEVVAALGATAGSERLQRISEEIKKLSKTDPLYVKWSDYILTH